MRPGAAIGWQRPCFRWTRRKREATSSAHSDNSPADGNPMPQALAAAGMIESYFFEWSDFHPMRRWLDTLEPLLDRLNFSGRWS